jgi:hypothetical protein
MDDDGGGAWWNMRAAGVLYMEDIETYAHAERERERLGRR